MRKHFIYISPVILLLFFLTSCDPENVIEKETTKGKTETADDYVWDNTNVKTITFNGTSIATSTTDVKINGTTATITASGYYLISGSLADGQLVIDAPKSKLKLMLDNVAMANSTTAPFYIKSATKVILFLKSGTTNKFSDATVYKNPEEVKAAITSEAYLGITGDGTLSVTGNYNDAISSDDPIVINSGNINIGAVDDAIRSKDYLVVHGGNINATCVTGHALKADSSGVSGYGYVKINGGNFTLSSSTGDGIHAYKRILIEDGVFNIVSDDSQALRSDSLLKISGGTITVKNTKTGMESPCIAIEGGTVGIATSKIAVSATFGASPTTADNSLLTISGGNVYVNSLSHALSSDGNIKITGGTTVVQGPSSTTKLMAKCLGEFTVSGGFFVGCGPNAGTAVKGFSANSTQNSTLLKSSSIGINLINIQDANGSSLVTFKPIRTAYYIVFSSPLLTTGNAYSIYTGGSYTGGTTVNGYSSGGTYSIGTSKATFTVSGKVTETSF